MDMFSQTLKYIDQLQSRFEISAENLLQLLFWIQHKFLFIPPEAISLLAEKTGVTQAQIRGVVDFYSFFYDAPRGQYNILFSDSITDHMLGSRERVEQLCQLLQVEQGLTRADGMVTVDTTSCTGLCDQGPAMLVNGLPIGRLDKQRIETIANLVNRQIPLQHWDKELFTVHENIYRTDLLLGMAFNAGDAIKAWQNNGTDKLLAELEQSGLRGRGGAGFRTALKWSLCKQADADARYVVCNADEGEPGTFKDRVLLQSYTDEIIEGMTLCAALIDASKGFIYLRGEYFYLLDHLESVLEKRRQKGLLGININGVAGFDFDVRIHMGAGAYICGEESALIESLEGKRGIPRVRPPFPVTNGYLDKPTVVNNVETFVSAAGVAVHGSEWFRDKGTEQSSGTKILSISGDCAYPGIYEYPFGTSIQTILDDCGATHTQAVQAAGAAGETLPVSEFDRSLAFEDVSTAGSFMVFNDSRNLLDMVQNFAHFFVHESCGFCTPCRVGSSLLRDLVDKLCDGHANDYDLNEMQSIANLMHQSSHCGLGHTAPNTFLSILRKFPQLYHDQLRTKTFEPAFDLDMALSEARQLAEGRS